MNDPAFDVTASRPQPELIDGFRQAMRRHAAGIALVTVGGGEEVNGMAVTALASFSMDPPSLLVCVNKAASISPALSQGARFGVTLLGRGHTDVVKAFSRKPGGRPRFEHPGWRLQPGELPILEDAVANLACMVEATLAYGTHRAIVGRVLASVTGPAVPSLIYHDGGFL